MKRYYTPDIVFGPVSEDEEVHSVYKASEVQALLRAAAEGVKGMPHDPSCYSQTHCGSGACKFPPWSEVHIMGKPHYFHEFEPGNCNCSRGKVLAMLEVE